MKSSGESSDVHQLACSEIWGGNQSVDQRVGMEGVEAWMFSEPFEGASAGGDLYYFSR